MVERGIAGAGVAVAATAVVTLHLTGAGRVDPMAQTVSDYVGLPEGPALLGLAAAGLIIAGAVAAVRMAGPARRVLTAWTAAVLLVALFPTNLPDQPPDLAAFVHRWAGALVFTLPPIAGVLASRTADPVLRRRLLIGSVVSATAACAFLAAHAPHVLAGAAVFGWLGLIERVAYVALLALMVLLASYRPGVAVLPAPVRPVAVDAGTGERR